MNKKLDHDESNFIITNNQGREFFIRTVQENPSPIYGPTIEFYDYTYANEPGFDSRGQFVSSYYASTLAERPINLGINLHGGVPNWQVDADAMLPVHALAQRLIKTSKANRSR